MKIEVRNDCVLYVEHGDYTIYIDFSIDGETMLHRYMTDEDDEKDTPMIVWEDGSDAMTIL